MKAEYRKRIADQILEYRLEEMGAVLIEGPKWCGKTTTAEQQAQSVLFLSDPDKQKQYLELSHLNTKLLLAGDTPRLIDEWQLAPHLWDAVRHEVDQRRKDGQFILTGSAVPPSTETIHHSGTGRYAWITMRPMSLWESGESTGEISLDELFKGKKESTGTNTLELADIAFLICRGGWPATLRKSRRAALHMAYDYYDAVIRTDVSRANQVEHDPERLKALMRSYARHQGAQVPVTSIRNDIAANEEDKISINSLHAYLVALEKIFVIEDMRAWNPNIRSKTAIRTSDTRYFVDPSIAAASLGIGPDDLINDLETFGLLFETLCVRDLRVYADALDGKVYHYRDKEGLECDAVIHRRDGSYGLIEVKLGGDKAIEHGAETLKTLKDKIDTTRMKAPSFLMVLTAIGSYAFKRSDDVWIVPVGCLKD
ncbi:MAG: DUF4143 domain-containing protein [Odoribacter sp.]|nr:DUF4143 domain-containing protein [Odoribacter sp.]